MIANLRIIGDVHGHFSSYHHLIKKAQQTLQVGDFGFDYTTLRNVDPKCHRILPGNHDNYNKVGDWPHFLGDYGNHNVPGFGDIFYVRGGLSIDRHIRTEGVNWWQDEELGMTASYKALAEYSRIKPQFVVTHTCPTTVIPYVTLSMDIRPSRTSQLLEQMFAVHQPARWVFGHFHRSFEKDIDGTRFTCLPELGCLDF
jgi:hypothetical protein